MDRDPGPRGEGRLVGRPNLVEKKRVSGFRVSRPGPVREEQSKYV